MARSPEAQIMRQRDREFRDAQHVATLQKEGGRLAAEPVAGKQPWPRKSRSQKDG